MRHRIITAVVIILSLFGILTAHAGFFQSLGKALGIKENSALGQITRAVDNIGNAVVAKKVNDTMKQYGSEQVESYDKWAQQYNENKDRKVQQYLSEVDQYKMDYCKSHGFYESWYRQYGDQWFERAGSQWFDRQNEHAKRTTGDYILPWHLRDSEGMREKAEMSKADPSLTNVFLNSIGLTNDDVRRADEWVKSDKYGRQEIIIDGAFDVISASANNKDMVDAFRRIAKANNQYLKDKADPTTSNVAMPHMAANLTEIVFDSYNIAAENRKAVLNEKLQISRQLEEKGYDHSLAREVAGTILGITTNNKLTDHEKKEWLRLLGYSGSEDSVMGKALEVAQMTEKQAKEINEAEQRKKKEIAEKEKREREEKERKERQRNEAMAAVNELHIDSYTIGETEMNDEQKLIIDRAADILAKHPDLTVEVTGFTCDLGSTTVNERIGLNRAEKVKDYLVESGISEKRISTSTLGEVEPLYPNNSAENRRKNRRVMFNAK